MKNIISRIAAPHSSNPLQPSTDVTVFKDRDASVWMLHQGQPTPGKSQFYASSNGNHFRQLIETGINQRPGGYVATLEAINLGMLRFEVDGDSARLFHTEITGDTLIAGGLELVGTREYKRITAPYRADFYRIGETILKERVARGDPNAILMFSDMRNYSRILPKISDEGAAALIKRADVDQRAFFALCIAAERCKANTREILEQYDCEKLAQGARHFEWPRQILWQRARDGDVAALNTLHALALDSHEPLIKLFNLFVVWEVPGTAELMGTLPIEGRDLKPSILSAFARAGHPDAENLLYTYVPQSIIKEADTGYERQNDLLNCFPVQQLGTLVRHNNQAATEGLFMLYASGHLPARELMRKLVKEGVLRGNTTASIDLTSLGQEAAESSIAVISLFQFHNDGHPDALGILQNLPSIDLFVERASESYTYVCALSILDQAGDKRVREAIDRVSTRKWQTEYNWRGHAKLEGREARSAMGILASLGNATACDHEGISELQRRAQSVALLQAVKKISETTGVEIMVTSPPKPLDQADPDNDEDTGSDEPLH